MDSSPETTALPPEVGSMLESWIEQGRIELPSLPQVTSELLSATFDDECSLSRIEEIVSRDPHLAGQMLRHANSALFAPVVAIQSLTRALAQLGLGRVRDVALKVSCESRVFQVKAFTTECQELLRHSKTTGVVARQVAPMFGLPGDEAFILGLLHDIGRPVLLQTLSDMRSVLRVKLGKSLDFSIDSVRPLVDQHHERVGAAVIRTWGLPESVASAIAHHHQPSSIEMPEVRRLVWTVRLADALDREDEVAIEEAVTALDASPAMVDDLRGRYAELAQLADSI